VLRRFHFAPARVHNEREDLLVTDARPLLELIRLARRRLLLQHALEHVSWGAVAGLTGLLMLLIAGTQILNWYWPMLLVAAATALSWYRGRQGLPGEYQTARRVDAVLDDQDTLATAYHFSAGSPVTTPHPAFLDGLQARAAETISHVDPAGVLPLRRPRAAISLLVLAVIAAGLFAARYGLLQSLDLRAPIAQVSFDTLTGTPTPPDVKRAAQRPNIPQPETLFLPEGERASVEESELAHEEAMRQFETAANTAGRPGEGQDARRSEAGMEGEESGEGSEDGDNPSEDSNLPAGTGDPREARGDAPPPKSPENNSSLMDKMRDALANLMEKMKAEPQGTDQKQMAANKKAGGQSGEGQKQQSDRGSPTKGESDSQGDPGDAQGDPDGDAQHAQSAQSPGQQSSDTPSADQKSGVGQQDGRKDTELAEHAEAMGKLTELLGKRSQNLQGEIMVEVTNSRNQQARTPYERREAARGEGGESTRDEVPLHLQPYIQQFYEQVRRAPTPPPATKR
jgi:hypothetical protein